MKRAFKKIETGVTFCTERVQINCLARGLSSLIWRILDTVSGVQISVDALVTDDDLIRSKKEAYLIGVVVLALLAITIPDRIPSILSSSEIDTTTVLERTHALIKEARRLLPGL